jgi:hypothetical protein
MQVKDPQRQRPLTLHPNGRFFRSLRAVAVACMLHVQYRGRHKFVAAPLLKRLRNCRFVSKTATWIRMWFKKSVVGNSRKLLIETTGAVIETCTKYPKGPTLTLNNATCVLWVMGLYSSFIAQAQTQPIKRRVPGPHRLFSVRTPVHRKCG